MEGLSERFRQNGGLYNYNFEEQSGGKKDISPKLSPRSDNWKKKYLEIKIELENLKKDNEKLKKQLTEK